MPSVIPCGLSPLISPIHSSLSSDSRRTVSSKLFDTQTPLVSTEELVLPRHARCVLPLLRYSGHTLLLNSYLSRIERIHPSRDTSSSLLISFYPIQLRTLWAAHSLETLCLSRTSGPCLGKFPGFWGSMVSHHAPTLRKGTGDNNNNTAYEVTV